MSLTREWENVSNKRLKAINLDTIQECPNCNYSAAEIYDITSELIRLRELIKQCHSVIWLNCLEPVYDTETVSQKHIETLLQNIEVTNRISDEYR